MTVASGPDPKAGSCPDRAKAYGSDTATTVAVTQLTQGQGHRHSQPQVSADSDRARQEGDRQDRADEHPGRDLAHQDAAQRHAL